MAKPARSGPGCPDMALWREAMRGVAPLRGRPAPAPVPAAPAPATTADASPPPRPTPSPLPPLSRHAGLDRASAQRLRRGLYPIEARLDLHGMTQSQAHRALAAFLHASRTAGRRCVLVITGNGRRADGIGGGILKGAVPRWLDEAEFRHQVLAVAAARPRDGGGGAIYLLLRRQRVSP